jgi:hypothetical protein
MAAIASMPPQSADSILIKAVILYFKKAIRQGYCNLIAILI